MKFISYNLELVVVCYEKRPPESMHCASALQTDSIHQPAIGIYKFFQE